jgi:hypothetical protein
MHHMWAESGAFLDFRFSLLRALVIPTQNASFGRAVELFYFEIIIASTQHMQKLFSNKINTEIRSKTNKLELLS